MSINKITVSSLPYYLDNTSDPTTGSSAINSTDITYPTIPTSTVTQGEALNTSKSNTHTPSSTTISTTAPPPSSTITKGTSPPVVYIAAPIVVMILALIALIVVMVTVILACKRKQNSVKDRDLRENVSYSQTPNLQLSPHTGQVESQTPQSHSDTVTEKVNGVECTSAGEYHYIVCR